MLLSLLVLLHMHCNLHFTMSIYEILCGLLMVLAISDCGFAGNVPANFVFGDSLVDVGNNNYIVSLSKANYPPNGIDFGIPTGRYTNGRTIVDIIGYFCYISASLHLHTVVFFLHLFFLSPGQELGLGLTPPYLAPTTRGSVILKGVNYASGGGGILNETGRIFVSIYPDE